MFFGLVLDRLNHHCDARDEKSTKRGSRKFPTSSSTRSFAGGTRQNRHKRVFSNEQISLLDLPDTCFWCFLRLQLLFRINKLSGFGILSIMWFESMPLSHLSQAIPWGKPPQNLG